MKVVLLLLNTDRFAHPLIEYLKEQGKLYNWKIIVASMFDQALFERMSRAGSSEITVLHIKDQKQCDKEIRKADVIIGMMPDVMLLKVAETCIAYSKKLISPSRLNRQLYSKKSQAEENDALILVECGFTPGLDHITAKKMIDHVHAKGGSISSFKTYSSSLAHQACLNNPWQLKLTGPASELLNMGKGNNRYLVNGQLQHVPCHQFFSRAETIAVDGLGEVIVVPEDDGLYCRKIYNLGEAATVLKGRILRKGFESVWNLVIQLGLTSNAHKIEMLDDWSFFNYLRSLVPYSATASLEEQLKIHLNATDADVEKLKWLGLFEDSWFEGTQEITPALMMQYLLDNKLAMEDDDKDCIVVRHEMEYSLNAYQYRFVATLISEGEDLKHSALAKAIGQTTGAAAKSVLLGNIKLKGVHTPTRKEVYDPVLNELEDLGVAFVVEEHRSSEVVSA